ncbi:MAG: hypothetical protein OSB75_00390 [Dehalococcoidia bacterium]|nr:hypothetical protein [Dehalococcoidia bacterium]
MEERLDAVISLYQPTKAGEALLRSLDLRQMEGEPGYFGSYGFSEWAGVGEASPIGVIHELGHSYWGGFPVTGRPELSWGKSTNGGRSTAMESYHQDILTFMAQPPDDYELLRQRLRNLPAVSIENPEPVFHHLEADVPYTTGGSLNLVPPILRKYWDKFLPSGRFDDWYGAAGWFQSLAQDEITASGKWLGFEHLDLRQYPDLEAGAPPDQMLITALSVLVTEEQERLRDLTYQFDFLIGDAQNEENFEFWRRYLRDKITIYKAHPSSLVVLSHSRSEDLASALKFLAAPASGNPVEQAQRYATQLTIEPFLVNFLPAINNQVLVELFSSGATLPQGATLQATASFVERLNVFGAKVDSVLEAGRFSSANGATELEVFVTETGINQTNDLKLFFDLFKDRDRERAKAIVLDLSDTTIQKLMVPIPFQLRTILSASELLPKLGITADRDSNLADLKQGIALLIDEPSGNFKVDEPFLSALYQVVAERAERAPGETAQILLNTHFPLEGFILAQPEGAASIFKNDISVSLELVRNSDPVLAPPWRIIYRLIKDNPSQAARLLAEFHQRGENNLVAESLAYLAYDKDRSEKAPLLPISLEGDFRFLTTLFTTEGDEWLEDRLSESVELYRQRVADGEISHEFLDRYRETLEFAAAYRRRGTSDDLTAIIRRAFRIS